VLNGNLSSGVNGYTDVVNDNAGGPIVAGLRGSFDGNDNSISDVSFGDSSETFSVFGSIAAGTVKNLNVNYGNVVCNGGGSVFYITENATIENVSVDASIDGNDVAALIYRCDSGTVVNDCSIEGSIDATTAGGVVNTMKIPDSGLNEDITIDNCDVNVDMIVSDSGSGIVHTIDREPTPKFS
jgi:hypothetical protein